MNLNSIRLKQSLSTFQYLFGHSNINESLFLDIIVTHKKIVQKIVSFLHLKSIGVNIYQKIYQ